MNTKKRLDYLDMAKGLGMLLVLIGHLQGDTIFSLSPYFHPLCVFIFSFHMPLFFIISGILIHMRDETGADIPMSVHIKKRFKGIMIPYFWFSLFYFSVVIYAFIKGSVAVETLLVNLWYVLSCYGMNVLWFLPALFFGEILFLFLKKKLSKKYLCIAILAIAIVAYSLAYLLTLFSYETSVAKRLHELAIVLLRPFLVCAWIYIGYLIRSLALSGLFNKVISELDRNILDSKPSEKLKSRIIYISAGLVLLVLCAVLSKVNNGVDFRSLVLRNAFFYVVCSILGSIGLILLCKGLPRIRLFTFWGVGSLTFMAVHNSETVLYYALKASMYVNQFITHARGYICYLVILGILLTYTSLMILIIEKFFPFILGRSYHKKINNE